MRRVNMHEAKTHLSRLVEEAAAGEPFLICKAGRQPRRRLGLLAGQCQVPDDFDRIAADETADLIERR
jgi:antitoxin (DNA-binding transcriptional repressor) of toxin-antitoxin stability system